MRMGCELKRRRRSHQLHPDHHQLLLDASNGSERDTDCGMLLLKLVVLNPWWLPHGLPRVEDAPLLLSASSSERKAKRSFACLVGS